MSLELIVFLVMLATFMLGCFLAKLPVGVSMLLSATAGVLAGMATGLVSGPFPVRHLVEGSMSYLDTILVISSAMIFMKSLEMSGALNALSVTIVRRFHKQPVILLILIMIIIMFPGMITGSSTAAVLSAGSIVAPVLLLMGIDKISVASIIAMGGMLGMVAPPVNLPAMIIGGGIDTPYVGFAIPLLLMTVPLAIFSVLFLGLKQAKQMNYAAIEPHLDNSDNEKYGMKLYLPILVLVVLMVCSSLIPQIPDTGMPLNFLIAAFVGLFTGRKINFVTLIQNAIHDALPVMAILMGVGMFIQVMTLTGVRGLIVVTCLSLPEKLLYIAAGVSLPLFGAVSAFGAASVLGVPFTLAMLKGNTIVTIAALSLVTSLGDMMPPTALAGMFAAKITKVENYVQVLKRCLVPMLAMLLCGVLFMMFSSQIAAILP